MSHDPVFRISNSIRNSVASVEFPSTNSTTSSTAVTGIEVRASVENSSDDDGGDDSDGSNEDGGDDYFTYDDGTTAKRTAIKSCGGVPRRLSFNQNGSQEDGFFITSKTTEDKDDGAIVAYRTSSTTGRVQAIKQRGLSETQASGTPQVSQTTKQKSRVSMTPHVSQAMSDHRPNRSQRQTSPILTSGPQSGIFAPATNLKRRRNEDDTSTQPKKKLQDEAGHEHTRAIFSARLKLPLCMIETASQLNSCIRQRLNEFGSDHVLSLDICDMLKVSDGALSALKGSLERAQGSPK
jgi:hypothetical protein